jgi:hypothetical protein
MKKVAAILSVSAMLFACGNSNNSTTDETAKTNAQTESENDGWISLFDGKSTAGWHTYGGSDVGKAWIVNDGVLTFDADSAKDGGGGNLTTDEEYENFHFKYEWKISPNGNSGILFLVHEDPKFGQPYETGPEMQIVDNDGHPDGKIHKHQAGDLYDLIPCSTKTVKPVGEWNQAEIICNNGQLELVLNGTSVVKTTLWTDEWNQLVAGSKFKDWEGFGKYKKGKISLQDHGNTVSFRNISIKKL